MPYGRVKVVAIGSSGVEYCDNVSAAAFGNQMVARRPRRFVRPLRYLAPPTVRGPDSGPLVAVATSPAAAPGAVDQYFAGPESAHRRHSSRRSHHRHDRGDRWDDEHARIPADEYRRRSSVPLASSAAYTPSAYTTASNWERASSRVYSTQPPPPQSPAPAGYSDRPRRPGAVEWVVGGTERHAAAMAAAAAAGAGPARVAPRAPGLYGGGYDEATNTNNANYDDYTSESTYESGSTCTYTSRRGGRGGGSGGGSSYSSYDSWD